MKQNDDIATKTYVKQVADNLTEQIKQSKDETLTRLDKILGLFQKLDDEKTVMAYRQREHSDQLEVHENRIKSLETKFLQ